MAAGKYYIITRASHRNVMSQLIRIENCLAASRAPPSGVRGCASYGMCYVFGAFDGRARCWSLLKKSLVGNRGK